MEIASGNEYCNQTISIVIISRLIISRFAITILATTTCYDHMHLYISTYQYTLIGRQIHTLNTYSNATIENSWP